MSQTQTRRYMRRSEAQWRELIRELRQSGLSRAAFCQMHGLSLSSLSNRLRRSRDAVRVRSETLPDFVELTAVASPATPAPRTTLAWDVELTLGPGVVLRLRSGRC